MKGRKTGGRTKGTPNKTTVVGKEVLANMLADYQSSGHMAEDFYALDPKMRMIIAEKLFGYVLPKLQSVQADVTNKVIDESLAATLNELANE